MPRVWRPRSTIDWSDVLRSEPEKLLLEQLSCFAGGWTLDAADG
ncbi:MAG TPA: hypothetical protein VKV73_24615 [Chloroflexota bacterium]|nr:hypothetical protein [Chloroflexota bacterium]